MPYVAKLSEDLIKSFEIEETDWKTLKNKSKGRNYLFCPELDEKGNPCNVPLIPKTYVETGTQFFTHKSTHKCIQRDKDDLHKQLEYLILKIIHDRGFMVKMDNEVLIPYKKTYRRPDILIKTGDQLISFEIQLSRQTKNDYVRRTEEYQQAGINQVIWIGFPYRDSLNSLPFVRLVCRRAGSGYNRKSLIQLIEKEKSIPLKIIGLNKSTTLVEFIEDILNGTLSWGTCKYREEINRNKKDLIHWHNEEICQKEYNSYLRRQSNVL